MKKAQIMQITMAIFWLVFLSLQLFSVVSLTRMFIRVSVDIRGVEARVFINKAVYSPYGITVYDSDIGRVYPNIIDFEKFTTEHIQTAVYNPESFRVGIKMTLKNLNHDDIKTIFMDEESYFAEIHSITEERIVVINYADGRKEPGILEISVS
jgi:hypothetical protein